MFVLYCCIMADLCNSCSESNLNCVSIQWNMEVFVNVLKFVYGCQVDVTSKSFLSLFEAALYFGAELLLLKCKTWFSEVTSSKRSGLLKVQLEDLIHIWNFGLEHANDFVPELCASYLARNFMWAMYSKFFGDVPYNLLFHCIKHPHLTVYSERHLSDALLVWLNANREQLEALKKAEDDNTGILKQIRISVLPLWFAAGQRRSCYFSELAEESIEAIFRLMKNPPADSIGIFRDGNLDSIRIRLNEYSKKVDLSGCPQVTSVIVLLSLLPSSYCLDLTLRKSIRQSLINLDHLSRDQSGSRFWHKLPPTLSFEAVEKVDISKCPRLHLESTIEFFSKSFPSLRKLRAAYLLNFKTITLHKLMQNCPLISEVDLTVDITPLIPTQLSVISSSPATVPRVSNKSLNVGNSIPSRISYHSGPSLSKISRLVLEGRSDISDLDLQYITELCVSLQYLNLKGVDTRSLLELISEMRTLTSLCLRDTCLIDDVLYSFSGSSLEILDVSNTMISGDALAHIIKGNPFLKCLNTRGCKNLIQQGSNASRAELSSSNPCRELYAELGEKCILEEISLGWGFCSLSVEALRPAITTLRAISVGLGGSLGEDACSLLPTKCPMLESITLYFQVISDAIVINFMTSLKHLELLSLCYCLGDISISSFKNSIPNLRKLKLERVTPWMTNNDLVVLTQNFVNLVEFSLVGCRHLTSDSLHIISHGWPGLISIHLEDCGEVTTTGVSSLFNCRALEDILLRHNGRGIQSSFILDAASKMPLLRKISLDLCDACEGDFDIPDYDNKYFLSIVKIARCKFQRSSSNVYFQESNRSPVHKDTLVLVWNTQNLNSTVVKERL
ncbi:BTB/POZ domain-containing protein FBL11 isoform X5 [Ricinus communis]|uniref:BTB/POZ domain-containing protein FBL11 isoform X5 n=1 Tax=Ricinus communis TaxID=3988 RepID=UPI00201AE90E|nr:BTB/POZ domain-containing protein FBL11 isoform X5 [Ricinus communis]